MPWNKPARAPRPQKSCLPGSTRCDKASSAQKRDLQHGLSLTCCKIILHVKNTDTSRASPLTAATKNGIAGLDQVPAESGSSQTRDLRAKAVSLICELKAL